MKLKGGLYKIWESYGQRYVTLPMDKVRTLEIPKSAYARWYVPVLLSEDRVRELCKSKDVLMLEIVREEPG